MALKINLLCLFAVACILIYETPAQQSTQQPEACTDPIMPKNGTSQCFIPLTRYGYNATSGTCVQFQVCPCPPFLSNRCNTNSKNNFGNIEECKKMCVSQEQTS